MRVVREAVATGAGSMAPSRPSDAAGETSGSSVESASGSRRVRKSVEACR